MCSYAHTPHVHSLLEGSSCTCSHNGEPEGLGSFLVSSWGASIRSLSGSREGVSRHTLTRAAVRAWLVSISCSSSNLEFPNSSVTFHCCLSLQLLQNYKGRGDNINGVLSISSGTSNFEKVMYPNYRLCLTHSSECSTQLTIWPSLSWNPTWAAL